MTLVHLLHTISLLLRRTFCLASDMPPRLSFHFLFFSPGLPFFSLPNSLIRVDSGSRLGHVRHGRRAKHAKETMSKTMPANMFAVGQNGSGTFEG